MPLRFVKPAITENPLVIVKKDDFVPGARSPLVNKVVKKYDRKRSDVELETPLLLALLSLKMTLLLEITIYMLNMCNANVDKPQRVREKNFIESLEADTFRNFVSIAPPNFESFEQPDLEKFIRDFLSLLQEITGAMQNLPINIVNIICSRLFNDKIVIDTAVELVIVDDDNAGSVVYQGYGTEDADEDADEDEDEEEWTIDY